METLADLSNNVWKKKKPLIHVAEKAVPFWSNHTYNASLVKVVASNKPTPTLPGTKNHYFPSILLTLTTNAY